MNVDDEKLMAFADGELPPDERAVVERALAQDATLREKLAQHQRLRAHLSQAFDSTLSEPVPQHLSQILEPMAADAARASASGTVVDLAQARAAKWTVREWGAMAASLAAGLVIAFGATGLNAPMIAPGDDGLRARGALAAALEAQLAADDSQGGVRIGLSFRARDGGYCRTFDLTRSDTSGLACRDADGWRVDMTAVHAAGGEVRMAGAAEAVLAAVEARIAGAPLDADAEARARDAGWR